MLPLRDTSRVGSVPVVKNKGPMAKPKGIRNKNCETCGENFEYATEKARFCSRRCRSLSSTSSRVFPCSMCGKIGKLRRPIQGLYTCRPCRTSSPVHGRGYYMRTRCSCTICREAVNSYQRVWNSEYFKKNGSTYGSEFDYEYWYVSKDTRFRIFERDNWTCQLCFEAVDFSAKVSSRTYPTLDHIVCQSWTDEPDHSTSNLRLVCKSCNSKRRDAPDKRLLWEKDPQQWEKLNKRLEV